MPRAASRSAPLLLTAAALCLAAPLVGAAEAEQDGPLINFVFASQLGSGVYAAGDRVVQVYRVPVPFTLRSEEEHRWGIRLNFPVALGFYDFRTRDIFEGDLPDTVSTLTLLGGAELMTRVGEHWTLGPMGEIGYARDFANDADSAVYSVGVQARGVYEHGGIDFLLNGRAVWAGQSEASRDLADDFMRTQSSVEARRDLPWRTRRHSFDVGLFAANHLFFDTIAFYRFPQDVQARSVEEASASTSNMSAQWELGFTVGSTPGKLGRVPLPRLGLSYLFGDEPSAVRFVIGAVF